MKMIIVLDKICLAGVVGVSLYVGYKVGVAHTELREAKKILKNTFKEAAKDAQTSPVIDDPEMEDILS